MPPGLIAVAIGGFGIGLTEFGIMGLLPDLASDFGVSEATAGWLISGYALSVVVGALFLTAATTRLPRKKVLTALFGLFIAGNLLSAIAPTYEVMLAGRIIAALCHGAFTYIAYTLTEVSGFPTSAVPWLLVLLGIGLFLGNTAGGKASDRSVDATLVVLLAGLTVVLIFFGLTAHHPVAAIASLLLMGGFGFALVPGLQIRVMTYASDAPTLASGANIAAFNLGNALGAWLGGVTISAGLGYTSPIWAGAAITTLGLLVMLYAASAASAASAARTAQAVVPARQLADSLVG